ncbi:MAG: histidine triad nucleotide-binding protein [Eubacterium sp.]|jgi:histidine triad (HIT) family protein|nr:histidine triad nucleotide-binding protein [Eubacterium sp.]
MAGCIFCKIAAGELPSEKIYEDDEILAFNDLYPVAPVHALIIPKVHIDGINMAKEGQEALLGRMLLTAKKIAEQKNLKNGYRILTNVGEDGGQSVKHLHFHIIGGRKLEAKFG